MTPEQGKVITFDGLGNPILLELPEAAVVDALDATVTALTTAKVPVLSLADFPAPVSGVITLASQTGYEISGLVDIGTNRIEVGAKTSIRGHDRINDILTGTGTGAFITCDSSVTVKQLLSLESLTLKNVNGSLLNFTSTSANQSLVVNNCTLMDCVTYGAVNNAGAIVMRNTSFRGPCSTGGFAFTGTCTSLTVRDCTTGTTNTGTLFALGTSTWTNIVLGRNQFNSTAGQTIISGTTGGANVTSHGKISENIFWGGGIFAGTLTNADALWSWHDNAGFANTAIAAATATALATARNINGVAFDGTGNITVAAAGSTLTDTVPVAKGGTGLTAVGTALQVLRTNAGATALEWATVAGLGDVTGPVLSVANNVALFDGVTGKLLKDSGLNLSGTNTGDNAVNSNYSGLVSNATHTGDATGATALTVVAINGTSLAGLATGILKNTTTTGVPSIAVAGDFPILNQSTTGSAATLTTSRNINGVAFNGSANITVTAAADTLTTATLASGVLASSLTSVGTLTGGATGAGFTIALTTSTVTGTLPDARFPATLPALSGVNLTALNATNLGSGTVPDARFPATLPAASGVNLTALNGSNVATGTVADARIATPLTGKTLTTSIVNNQSLINNFSTASQAPVAATRTYITGSRIIVPVGKLQIGTMLRWTFDLTKTAAGIAASTFDICFGTAGTTADTARVSFTKPAGTGVVDTGRVTIDCIIRGPLSASGIAVGQFNLTHNLSTTGLANLPCINVTTVSGAFDVTVANLSVGVCITTGASDAYTIQLVRAEALNL